MESHNLKHKLNHAGTQYVALVNDSRHVSSDLLRWVAAALNAQMQTAGLAILHVNVQVLPYFDIGEVPADQIKLIVHDSETVRDVDHHGIPFAMISSAPHWSREASAELVRAVLSARDSELLGPAPDNSGEFVRFDFDPIAPVAGERYSISNFEVSNFVGREFYTDIDTPALRSQRYYDALESIRTPRTLSGDSEHAEMRWHDQDNTKYFRARLLEGKQVVEEILPEVQEAQI